jgi:pimeloyl-ACP methyl ester carboxylesterase
MDGSASPYQPAPFRIAIDDAVLEDLRRRLADARWPDEAPGHPPWQLGADLNRIRALAEYWRDGYDWRAEEAALNALPQFVVELDQIRLHFIHCPGRGPAPLPLLLPHGWPSSTAEMRHFIPMLTDPARFGGDPEDAFSVVAPSLPGHGFSYRAGQRRLSIPQIADLLATLMTDVLGYRRFGVQGGDWGAFIATRLGFARPEILLGIHLSLLAIPRERSSEAGASAEEAAFYDQLDQWLREETGYIQIMGTKPQTLAYALHDSPAGILAWIVEKWQQWTDFDRHFNSSAGRDALLTNVMLYWATGAIGSTFWPYYARLHEPWIVPPHGKVEVPMGYAAFPKEILLPPRSLAERTYADIRRWTVMSHGGHFPALECPEMLVEEVRAFFRPLRRSLT